MDTEKNEVEAIYASGKPQTGLDLVLTAEQFIRFITPEVETEAHFTESQNERRSLGDYLADLDTRLQRMLNGEYEWVEALTPADLIDLSEEHPMNTEKNEPKVICLEGQWYVYLNGPWASREEAEAAYTEGISQETTDE